MENFQKWNKKKYSTYHRYILEMAFVRYLLTCASFGAAETSVSHPSEGGN